MRCGELFFLVFVVLTDYRVFCLDTLEEVWTGYSLRHDMTIYDLKMTCFELQHIARHDKLCVCNIYKPLCMDF